MGVLLESVGVKKMFKIIFLSFLVGHTGFLKDKIKERIKNKLESQPAPVASDIKATDELKPGDYTFSIKVDDSIRWFKVHVPSQYNSKKPIPLMFALHGGVGDMNTQSNDKYYHQITKSESANYVIVFPNGYSPFQSGKIATWNAGACCGPARDNKADDVKFIKMIIDQLKKQLNIDASKIFSNGMSNGGMMSYRLACELSDVFKGIAAVAGTDNTLECNPKNPISILHIHAENDDHVLFNGGLGPKALNSKAETTFNSVSDTIKKWVKINHCPEKAERILNVDGAYCDLYSPCKNNTQVKLCVTKTGGHSWPGGEKPRGTTESSKAISATDEIWSFLKDK